MKPSLDASEILSVTWPVVNLRFHCSLLFSVRFVSKYYYQFLICILREMTLRGKKALSRSLKCHSSLFLHPLRRRSPFRIGAKKRRTFQTRHVGARKPA